MNERQTRTRNTAASLLVTAGLLVSATSFAAGGGGGGGGGGGNAMQISTRDGLYVVDQPVPGEASMAGFVLASQSGSGATPVDTVVTVNGVALIHKPGAAPPWFIVNPEGPQPAVGADGFLHVVATSTSARASRVLNLACPVRVVVTTSPPIGSSLTGATALDMAWTLFPQNAALTSGSSGITFGIDVPQAILSNYDVATGTIGPRLATFQMYDQTTQSAQLAVQPTASTGYVAELSYPGIYVLDGNSGGYCGRVQRYEFTK